ncbi:MAG: GGDEF domain-containing protein [Anaerolineae bacterium]|nr:GGDEF domain-containing protein [Anaerolineae bacterium]
MKNFHAVLYEAVLVAFGKILAKYDVFTQGVIMRDIGQEVVAYLNEHGFGFQETDSVEDLNTLTDLFVKNGFAEALEITPAENGDTYIWTNLYGLSAYKKLYDLALNPFLACPLNLCMFYIAAKHKKKLKMHRKEFKSESITEAQYELVDDTDSEGNLDELVLQSARLFEIADEKQKLFHHQSITDTLTGLYNLRHVLDMGERIFEQAKKHHNPIAILIFDIDYFKVVNDSFGHSTGDAVLRKLADICRQSVRETDLLARYGGEEFIVILPNTHPARALEIAERLRKGVETTAFDDGKNKIHVTISIGIACQHNQELSFDSALKNADEALYRAKNEGRNRIAA